jgi:hypothetical protein
MNKFVLSAPKDQLIKDIKKLIKVMNMAELNKTSAYLCPWINLSEYISPEFRWFFSLQVRNMKAWYPESYKTSTEHTIGRNPFRVYQDSWGLWSTYDYDNRTKFLQSILTKLENHEEINS